jgi:hypothetical protein
MSGACEKAAVLAFAKHNNRQSRVHLAQNSPACYSFALDKSAVAGVSGLSQEHGKTAGLRHECLGCGGGKCPVDVASDEQLLDGWRLSLASLVFFALPPVCAILGATLCRSGPLNELAGAWLGLMSGLVAGGVMVHLFGDRKEAA